MTKELNKLENHVIVCGFGRLGRMLAQDLSAAQHPFVVIDREKARTEQARSLGYFTCAGDATEEDVLRDAGIARAKTLATVLPDDAANVFITLSAVGLNPAVEVIARGEAPTTERKLRQAGARRVVLPAHIGAERVAHMILHPGAADFAESDDQTRHLQDDLGDLGVHLEEIPIKAGSSLVGAAIAEVEASGGNSFLVVSHRRDELTRPKPAPDTVLEVGDRLIIIGHAESSIEMVRKSVPTSYHYRGAKT
jgi:voltage-gated potassium channel